MINYSPEIHGVTQSLLKTFMQCPTKARIYLKGYYKPGFSESLMFGSIFHEFLDVILTNTILKNKDMSYSDFEIRIHGSPAPFEMKVRKRFEEAYEHSDGNGKDIINKCINLAWVIVPLYFNHWKEDFFGEKKKNWLCVEEEFNVNLGIPFRGKWDGVFSYGPNDVWIFETKTKGRINEDGLIKTVSRDFQVLSYMVAYYLKYKVFPKGVIYNVVRKPGLRQGKSEDWYKFLHRIKEDIEKRPEWYFMRYESSVSEESIKKFAFKLSNLIVQFVKWYKSSNIEDDIQNTSECVNVYGTCPNIDYCNSNFSNKQGLQEKEKKLFSELSEV